jgi:uncharacterized protein
MAKSGRILWLSLIIFTLAPLTNRFAAGMEIPSLTGRVNDYADMLSATTERQLESVLASLEKEESTQLAVLTVTSLDGENLEEFSLKVAESWRLGQKGRDNGALLLIAKNDRKLRIEVGYGLEGTLTDLASGRIIRDIITPQFRNGNFDQGVIDGVGAMIGAVRGEFSAADSSGSGGQSPDDAGGTVVFFAFAFFFLGRIFARNRLASSFLGALVAPVIGLLFWGLSWLVLLLIPAGLIAGFLASLIFGSMRMSTGHWTSGGSSSSGGFSGGFSGGGGGFGGGGSSGGW